MSEFNIIQNSVFEENLMLINSLNYNNIDESDLDYAYNYKAVQDDRLVGYVDYNELINLGVKNFHNLAYHTNIEFENWRELKSGRKKKLVTKGIAVDRSFKSSFYDKLPLVSNIKVGALVPIYTDWLNETAYEGEAKILKVLEFCDNQVFIRKGLDNLKKTWVYYWKYLKCRVQFENTISFNENFITNRKIGYFYRVGLKT